MDAHGIAAQYHTGKMYHILLSIHQLVGCFPPGEFEKAAVNISAPVFSFTHVFSLLFVWRQESPGWH